MNAARISRPSSVRIGIFCRFGFFDDSRPVAVRSGRTWCAGAACTGLNSAVARRHRWTSASTAAGSRAPGARTSMILRQPFQHIHGGRNRLALAVFHRLGQVHLLNRTSPSCFGELMLNAARQIRRSLSPGGARRARAASTSPPAHVESIFTPASSMRASTGTSGRSISS